MFCENCGAKIPDTAKFCKFCGASQTPVDAPGTAETVQTPPVPVPSSDAGQADAKQALIDYLGALYTAEMGVIHANDLIKQLNAQKETYVASHFWRAQYFLDPRPTHTDYYALEQENIKSLEETIASYKKRKYEGSNFLTDRLVTLKLKPEWMKTARLFERHLSEAQERLRSVVPEKQKQEDRRYAAACAEYERKMRNFEKREVLRKAAWEEEEKAVCRSFDESVADIVVKRDEFLDCRNKLYGKGLLFEQFRDPVAEFQLRQYLRMGLVDRLEGPQGGYAFYLDELHANRICGSIKDLQKAMEERLDSLIEKMDAMVQQMRRANQMLGGLRSGISACCSAIEAGFDRTNSRIEGSVDRLSAQLREEIANQARPIRESVQNSEYNFYLDALRKELDDYQYGLLRKPALTIIR